MINAELADLVPASILADQALTAHRAERAQLEAELADVKAAIRAAPRKAPKLEALGQWQKAIERSQSKQLANEVEADLIAHYKMPVKAIQSPPEAINPAMSLQMRIDQMQRELEALEARQNEQLKV